MSETDSISCVVQIHGVPRSLLSRLDWAVSSVIGASAVFGDNPAFSWVPLSGHLLLALGSSVGSKEQMFSAHLSFDVSQANASQTASVLASELARWQSIWFEVSVECTSNFLGQRFCFTPLLGLFHAELDHAGNQVFGENQLLGALQLSEIAGNNELAERLKMLLGVPWDLQLEPLRRANLEAQYQIEKAS